MSLLALRDALVATGIPTYHFTAAEENEKYIVWAEEGETSYFRTAETHSLWADDHMAQQTMSGVINYITIEEYDANVDIIQRALYDAGVSYSLADIVVYRDLERIQYQWKFEMPVSDSIYG